MAITALLGVLVAIGLAGALQPKLDLEQKIAEVGRSLKAEPGFVWLFGDVSDEKAFEAASSVVLRGARRLDDPSVLELYSTLQMLMEHGDANACAAIVRGDMANASALAILEQLGDAAVDRYLAIMAKAIRAELHFDAIIPEPNRARSQQIVADLMRSLPAGDAERLQTAAIAPRSTADTDMCWAGRTMFAAALSLDDPDRAGLLRSFVDSSQGL